MFFAYGVRQKRQRFGSEVDERRWSDRTDIYNARQDFPKGPWYQFHDRYSGPYGRVAPSYTVEHSNSASVALVVLDPEVHRLE
jgi:hypothetical protein